MSKLIPSLKAKRIVSVLLKAGFLIQHQKGSHIRLSRHSKPPITISRHDKQKISHVITQAILKRINLSEKEFLKLL